MFVENYVFLGFNGLFGEYADIVHARGGRLVKVVINLPMDTVTGTRTFADQLAGYHRWLDCMGILERVEVQQLRDFRPAERDHHILAARGVALAALRDYLVRERGVSIEPLVHPTAILSPTVNLPEGIIIRAGTKVGADVKLGAYCALGTGCYVGHDSELGEFVDLSPGVHLASGVKIQRGARIGIQATVINNVCIGEESMVAAGAVVLGDVAPLTLVAGVPAVMKKILERRPVPATVPGLV